MENIIVSLWTGITARERRCDKVPAAVVTWSIVVMWHPVYRLCGIVGHHCCCMHAFIVFPYWQKAWKALVTVGVIWAGPGCVFPGLVHLPSHTAQHQHTPEGHVGSGGIAITKTHLQSIKRNPAHLGCCLVGSARTIELCAQKWPHPPHLKLLWLFIELRLYSS